MREKTFHHMTEEDFSKLLDVSGYRAVGGMSPWTFEFNGATMQLGFAREGIVGGRMKWSITHPDFWVLFEPGVMPSVPTKPEPSYGLMVKGDFGAYLKFIAYLRLLQ